MAEIFHSPDSPDSHTPQGLPGDGTAHVRAADIPWQGTGVEGFRIKPLFADPVSGQRTWLMRVDAGAFAPLHAHDEMEQIYVLEGTFYDQDRIYRAGEYAIRAPGAQHTAGSEDGATVLLFYSPAD